MLVKRRAESLFVEIEDGPLVSRHRPAGRSVSIRSANGAGPNAMGIMLTK
jgi:chemotaxis response regulator CheB